MQSPVKPAPNVPPSPRLRTQGRPLRRPADAALDGDPRRSATTLRVANRWTATSDYSRRRRRDHGQGGQTKRGTKPFRGKIIGGGGRKRDSLGFRGISVEEANTRKRAAMIMRSESVVASGRVQGELKGPRECELEQEESRESRELQLSHLTVPLAATRFLSCAR